MPICSAAAFWHHVVRVLSAINGPTHSLAFPWKVPAFLRASAKALLSAHRGRPSVPLISVDNHAKHAPILPQTSPITMRTVHVFTGQELRIDCIGCAISAMPADSYAGTIHVGSSFHVHQDLETALPGFVIISTHRHIATIADFTAQEMSEFGRILFAARKALRDAGFETVYMFQNEDSADHFHLWLFPAYPWMTELGTGPTLLAKARDKLKSGFGVRDPSLVTATARTIAHHMERYLA